MFRAIQRARLDVLSARDRDYTRIDRCACDARVAHAGASPATCAQVHSYAYTSPESSLCERAFLNAFWDYLVREWCPLWIAPNAMTLMGTFFCAVAYVGVLTMSPELTFAAPRWCYAAFAMCMFLYQTFDGCDGKQARRTKSGSPLGEVIDHGCDALAMCVYPVIVCDIFGVGFATSAARLTTVSVLLIGRAMFVVDTVSSTYTGVLPVSRFLDSQEVQLISQTVFIVAALFGNEVLSAEISIPGVGLTTTVGRCGAIFCITVGAVARLGTFYGTIMGDKYKAPPHWPKYRSPMGIAARCAFVEAMHGACLYYAPNFAYAHATSALLYGESEARIMSIRVSDPDFPVTNFLALFIMFLTTLVPEGDAFSSGVLIGAAMFLLIHRVGNLAAQITGCLGLHPNIFVLRPKIK